MNVDPRELAREFHSQRVDEWTEQNAANRGNAFPTPPAELLANDTPLQISAALGDAMLAESLEPGADRAAVEKLRVIEHTLHSAAIRQRAAVLQQEQQQQQRVGADPAPVPVWQNPLSQMPGVKRSPLTGDVYSTDALPTMSPPTANELRAAAERTRGGVRILDGRRPMWTFPRDVDPPHPILPADLQRWVPLRNSFPVYVTYPGFGAGLAVSFLKMEAPVSFAVGTVFLAVKKFTPLGPAGREPFALGFHAVPMWMAQMMEVAVANLYPAENIVVIDDFRGDQYAVAFTELRKTDDPRYVIARRALMLQYPYLMTDMMSTHLRDRPPADMQPGGTQPGRTARAPMLAVREIPQRQ